MSLGSLFAGIDAFALGLGETPVWQAEQHAYRRDVLAKRHPGAVLLDDVRAVNARDCAPVTRMCGGFPCQDMSGLGRGDGIGGARSGLWKEYARCIAEFEPHVVYIENVTPLLKGDNMRVLIADLVTRGYACEWDCIPAAAVGAPHLRDRVWIVARPNAHVADLPFAFGDPTGDAFDAADYTSRFPRAGIMRDGWVWQAAPIATQASCRAGAVFPTPVARDDNKSPEAHMRMKARMKGGPRNTITSLAVLARNGFVQADGTPVLWPMPRGSLGKSVSGGGEGSTYYRTPSQQAGTHGRYLQVEANELEVTLDPAHERGPLNPDWVEWLMGLPSGYTDLECDEPRWFDWSDDPANDGTVPRIVHGGARALRDARLGALGDSLVWQVAATVRRHVEGSVEGLAA